jgi:hypothetical protein
MAEDDPHNDDRNSELEQSLIREFLAAHGQTRQSVDTMPETDAAALLRAAIEFASLRLAEIQARAHYVDDIHRPS